jgi:hypothetical protein
LKNVDQLLPGRMLDLSQIPTSKQLLQSLKNVHLPTLSPLLEEQITWRVEQFDLTAEMSGVSGHRSVLVKSVNTPRAGNLNQLEEADTVIKDYRNATGPVRLTYSVKDCPRGHEFQRFDPSPQWKLAYSHPERNGSQGIRWRPRDQDLLRLQSALTWLRTRQEPGKRERQTCGIRLIITQNETNQK